jgi:hypothetical protein
MEDKEAGAGAKAKLLVAEFAQCFLAIRASVHPYGIPGEAAGKSSNVAFAARKIFANHQRDGQEVIITVMDGKSLILASDDPVIDAKLSPSDAKARH